MKKSVRTRFAPSPTGHLHIGNARTAVMNWLFARHTGGRFVLRIEDTDRERSTEESERVIFNDLQWLGLGWDEGPDRGGDFGPYRQSERLEIYREHILQLQKSERVYPCYCTPDELDLRRKERLKRGESAVYDGRCRQLSTDQKKWLEGEGRKPAIRFRTEKEDVAFEDLVKGRISFSGESIGDFILVRPDGMPMYNFACVVDDHRMGISHVIRGDDHVTNTSRQIILYRAFGWKSPCFVHIPMILGEDRVRLSKRHGATSVSQYRELGYLSEAFVNFLSLLSWSSESGDEILSRDRLIEEFNFSRMSKSAAVFDTEKLDWMNGVYIRGLELDRLIALALPFFRDAGYSVDSGRRIRDILSLLQDKLERLSQIGEKVKIFFQEEVIPESKDAEDILKKPDSKKVYNTFIRELSSVGKSDWDGETFKVVMGKIQEETGIKGKHLWMPIRVALTGQVHGPDLPKVAEILGYDKCRRFLQRALGDEIG